MAPASATTASKIWWRSSSAERHSGKGERDPLGRLVPSADRHLYALDASTGVVGWRFAADAPVLSQPLVTPELVVFTAGERLLAVHAASGELAWAVPGRGFSAGRAGCDGERVYTAAADGFARAHDLRTGREAWSHRMVSGDLHRVTLYSGWDDVIALNLTATFRLARAAVKTMMRRRHGRIIGITSVVGVTGNPGQVNYTAAKAGMIGMIKSIAQEYAKRGVTANCIAPGFIATAMTDKLNDKQREAILARVPAGRLGSGADVAAAAVYLASDEAAYVTGQTLHISGGMAMF